MRRPPGEAPLVVAVGGGKGGVGKSVVAVNLALAMARLGARVTAVDADLGSSNLHTLFGIDRPGQTLQAVFDGRVASLQEIVIPSGYPRLDLVPGAVAVPGSATLHQARKQKLLRHIATLDAEVVVVDCGAGIHYNVLDFFAAADVQLVVASPQLVSLQNAYGFVKATVYRLLRQHQRDAESEAILDSVMQGSETETMRQLLSRVEAQKPTLADELRHVLAATRLSILGNQLSDARELNALHALGRMIRDFLMLEVPVHGGLLRLSRIHDAVTRRRPFLSESGVDVESRLLLKIAESCLGLNVVEVRRQRDSLRAACLDAAGPPPLQLPAAESPSVLPAPLGRYQRAHERHEVQWQVQLRAAGGSTTALVRDISKGGAQLIMPNELACVVGDVVDLLFAGSAQALCLRARIVHRAEQVIGCEFDPKPEEERISALLVEAQRQQADAAPAPELAQAKV